MIGFVTTMLPAVWRDNGVLAAGCRRFSSAAAAIGLAACSGGSTSSLHVASLGTTTTVHHNSGQATWRREHNADRVVRRATRPS